MRQDVAGSRGKGGAEAISAAAGGTSWMERHSPVAAAVGRQFDCKSSRGDAAGGAKRFPAAKPGLLAQPDTEPFAAVDDLH